jgi:hypothetical protein
MRAGRNYGWPVITYGVNYGSGTKIGEGTEKPGMEQPLWKWIPSIAPSGMAFYTGDKFPKWKGNLFVGALAGQLIARLTLNGDTVVREERIRGTGRTRDIRAGDATCTCSPSPRGALLRTSRRAESDAAPRTVAAGAAAHRSSCDQTGAPEPTACTHSQFIHGPPRLSAARPAALLPAAGRLGQTQPSFRRTPARFRGALPPIGLGTWLTFHVGRRRRGAGTAAPGAGAVLRGGRRHDRFLADVRPGEWLLGQLLPAVAHEGTVRGHQGVDAVRRARPGVFEQSLRFWGVPRFDVVLVHNLLNWRALGRRARGRNRDASATSASRPRTRWPTTRPRAS